MDSFFHHFESSPDSNLDSMPDNMNMFDFEFPTSSLSDLFGNARDAHKNNSNIIYHNARDNTVQKKRKPFKIIREISEEKSELIEVSSNSKKIKKQQKLHQKEKINKDLEYILTKASDKYIPEGITNPNIDIKTQRRLIQSVKNRIAAQETRNRRKTYIKELESAKEELEDFNQDLLEKNRILEEKLLAMEKEKIELLAQNEELKRKDISQYLATDKPNEESANNETEMLLYSNSPQLSRTSPNRNSRFYPFLSVIIGNPESDLSTQDEGDARGYIMRESSAYDYDSLSSSVEGEYWENSLEYSGLMIPSRGGGCSKRYARRRILLQSYESPSCYIEEEVEEEVERIGI